MKKSDINILVIEDDKSMRESLTEAIKRRGFKVVAVGKPDEAESIVKIKPVHGLIVDVMLPGRNGVDLVSKLKENLMENAAVIFMSGIYRDRSFAAEAIKKTEALEFFTKPFNTEEMLNMLEQKLNEYVEAPQVALHALLSSPYASNRERRKALDHVEEMCGFDLPFVLCILMDAESSGHLNIVDARQNIYGITLAKGSLSRVDSEATVLLTKKLLIQHGFISELELSELKTKKSTGDLIKNLVDEGLMSPHVPGLIKAETITSELLKLVTSEKMKINFVPDRRIVADSDNLDLNGFTKYLHDMIDKEISDEWLKGFYAGWLGYPIKMGPLFNEHKQYGALPLLARLEGIFDECKKELILEELIAHFTKAGEVSVYKGIHFMMLRRMVVFEEVKRIKNLDEHAGRLKSMHAELGKMNPVEIFKYFGLGDNPKSADVVRIYKEFAKSHHPDTLPKTASAEVKTLNHELFSRVTAAYETLSDDEKRKKYFTDQMQQEAESQIKSDGLVTTGAQALARGQYVQAYPLLQEAISHYKSERSLLHFWWVSLKIEGKMKAEDLPEIEKQFRAMSAGMRKTALWVFVGGLIKRFSGDTAGASADFQKVLTLEENFTDARRELAQIKANEPKQEDLLTGDISVVMKGFFNKKKKGA